MPVAPKPLATAIAFWILRPTGANKTLRTRRPDGPRSQPMGRHRSGTKSNIGLNQDSKWKFPLNIVSGVENGGHDEAVRVRSDSLDSRALDAPRTRRRVRGRHRQ